MSVCHRLEAGSLRSGWQFRPGPCSCSVDGGFLQEDLDTGWTPPSPDGLEGKDQGAPGRVCDGDPTLSTPSRPFTEGVRCEPMNLENTTLPCTAGDLHGPSVGGRPGRLCGLGGSLQSASEGPVVAEGEGREADPACSPCPVSPHGQHTLQAGAGGGGACWSQTHR